MAGKPRLAVLISGAGRNLQAIIDAVGSGRIDAEIAAVISNRADAGGLIRARQAGIDTLCIPHQEYASREAFDAALEEALTDLNPDIIALAGFMRVLGAGLVRRHEGRMLNIHPSLLPAYPGLNTHQRAIDAGDAWHGASVHFVIPELDSGPVVLQGRVAIRPGDNAAVLAERVMREVEQHIYPEVLAWLAQGRLQYLNGRALLDGEPLTSPRQYARAAALSRG